ncbi:hypothetical protein B7G68_15205 [Caulobacter segnis]|uniref:MmcQ/YjbR family DNA-binding protein n=1 Tax=Caulobacter segnis TaxID=88688 RepID=A0ABM6TIR4_9CAUL|nr:MmcQ/YjbR family DNA-binding protein [Caulobacter segnis]AVQ03077.1 hypothetical protein B7G68_15205 [Caulobacter segnis]
MTPETFISLASGLAMVKAHTVMGAVRLAVHGKTFATVGWPEVGWAVIRLHPSDQAELLPLSQALAREPGRRGKKGVTLVHLLQVSEAVANRALIAAWRHAQGAPVALAKAS